MTEAPIISCNACELCASNDDVTDTPIAAPMLRSRLNSDAPSVRIAGGNVANASTCSGVNTSPMPPPWITIAMMISRSDTSGVQPVISQNEKQIISNPAPTSSRASTLFVSRPLSVIVARLPSPRGAMMRPAVSTG